MILLIVWDGLRSDIITAENTPFLNKMASRGVFCKSSHAVFPTATRINSASLTTGCYPSHHGIVDNELYIPAVNSQEAVSCADWRALQAMADSEKGRLLDARTLGEIIRDAGKVMASAGSGSPGTTYLTNPTATGPVANWAIAWPEEVNDVIKKRFGTFMGSDSTSFERNAFILEVMRDYLIPQYRPDLFTLWVTEPDHTQHRCGLFSPEAKIALKEIDEQLGDLIGTFERSYHGEDLTCILISDHGFSTVSETVNPKQELVAAGLKESPYSSDIIVVSNSIYLRGKARERLGEVIRFLQDRLWIGALFLRDNLLDEFPELMPQSSVFNCHRRSAEILFSYRWSPVQNRYNVPGSVVSSSQYAATHGSASPYVINNCLVAWGKGIKEGVVSNVPCGIIDVAPTALHLLGIKTHSRMDGRVLNEILEGCPSPEEFAVSHETRQCAYYTKAGVRRQVAHYSIVNGYKYLDRITMMTAV